MAFDCSSDSMCLENTDNPTDCHQTGEAPFAASTHDSAGVVERTVPSSLPQRPGILSQDADAQHKWNDSYHVSTSTADDPSQEQNAQCSRKGSDATFNASEQLASDCLRLEGTGIIAEGIASVLAPVMREFDGRAEGALKSQGILASSIDRLTRELDKLLDDAPIPFIVQHATKISSVRKRVLSLNSTLQCIQKRIDHIERMLSGQVWKCQDFSSQGKSGCGLQQLEETRMFHVAVSGSSSQDSLQLVHTLTSKGLETGSSSQQGESLTKDQSEHDRPDSFEAEHM